LCIEPCPVDCIEIIPLSEKEIALPRKDSQLFFDLKENLSIDNKRNKLKNFSDKNIEISNIVNEKIINRNIDKSSMIDQMQHEIIKSDLSKLHKFDDKEINSFLKKTK